MFPWWIKSELIIECCNTVYLASGDIKVFGHQFYGLGWDIGIPFLNHLEDGDKIPSFFPEGSKPGGNLL
jgi:hypothetical protein